MADSSAVRTRTDADEGAGESLKSSAIRPRNTSPAFGSAGSARVDRIAGAVEALLVERLGGQVRPAEVAGGDDRALDPDLVGVLGRGELDLCAG